MRHLGILAHSAEGAALCFRTFCQEGFRELGPDDHPDVTLDLIALARRMPAWDAGDHDPIRATLNEASGGSRRRAPTSSSARTTPRTWRSNAPAATCRCRACTSPMSSRPGRPRRPHARRRPRHPYTMDGEVYPRELAARGIAAEIPGAEDRETVNRIIFDELVNGVFTDESRRAYVQIIERLAQRGCDAVALVCTEIPLLVTPGVSPLPTLDSTRLLARAAFEVAAARRTLPTWRGGHFNQGRNGADLG